MSYCESCGRELRADAAFCASCGAKALPAYVASPPASVAQAGPGPQAPAASPYGQPMSPPVKTSGAGLALILIGAAITLLCTFMYYGWYSYYWEGGGGADQGWSFSFSTGSWAQLWPPTDVFSGAGSWSPLTWFQQISFVASMITALLCVAAAVLALVRAGGGRIGGSIIRAFGIAAAAATIVYMIAWALGGEYKYFAVTDLAAVAGAVLIIIGGTLLGPAAASVTSPGRPLPTQPPGDIH